jgi:hypothetical protein
MRYEKLERRQCVWHIGTRVWDIRFSRQWRRQSVFIFWLVMPRGLVGT